MELADELKCTAIRAARKRLKMKQLEFSQLIGCTVGTVSWWENAHRIPRNINWKMILLELEKKGIGIDQNGNVVELKPVH